MTVCKICGKEGILSFRKYCSRECTYKSQIGRPTWNKGICGWKCKPHKKYGLRKIPIEISCMQCNVIFKGLPGNMKNRKFCSKKCSNDNRVGKKVIMSEGHIQKLRWIGYANRGKKLTEEHKKKIGLKGERNPMFGKTHNEEAKAKIRARRALQIIPFIDTLPEKKLQSALEKYNINFEKHKDIIGQPDIFIEPNICIFVDGDYWHNYPFGNKRDIEVNEALQQKGYKVMRYWEREINANVDEVAGEIMELMI